MGMPTEFMTPEQIKAEYGGVNTLVSAPHWHPHSVFPAGRITDDTEQALALANIYIREGYMSADAAARAILDWAAAQTGHLERYLGPSTRQALKALHAGASPRKSGHGGKTNGAAMRIAPVGIVNTGDLDQTLLDTVEASLPTHGTTLAISGAAAVAFAIATAQEPDATLTDILEAAAEGAIRGRSQGTWTWTPPIEKRIALALQLVRLAENENEALQSLYDHVGVDLTVSESIPTALGLVALAEGDPMQATRHAANIGGDTDTIGAIAGAICGAMQGIDAVDRDLLALIEETNGLDLAAVARHLESVGAGRRSNPESTSD
jgi:ADP-ribosylglycohydrolase